MRVLRLDPVQHVQHHRLLLLEGAREVEAGVEVLDHPLQGRLGAVRLELGGDLVELFRRPGLVHRGWVDMLSVSPFQVGEADENSTIQIGICEFEHSEEFRLQSGKTAA